MMDMSPKKINEVKSSPKPLTDNQMWGTAARVEDSATLGELHAEIRVGAAREYARVRQAPGVPAGQPIGRRRPRASLRGIPRRAGLGSIHVVRNAAVALYPGSWTRKGEVNGD